MKKLLFIVISLLMLFFTGCSSNNTGVLQLKLTDAPTDLNIEKAEVTLSKVAVHMAETDENETSWITVLEENKTFDLIKLINVSTLLGEKNLTAGKYTEIRLSIDKALITIDGVEYDLDVPSDKLKFTKGFTIEEGKTTTLTIDFDAKESIIATGKGDYKLKPTIKIIEG